MMRRDIAGIILAGGQSRRMGGGDKSLLQLAGRHVLDEVVARFAPQVACVALSANGDPARFLEFGMPILADVVTGFAGPLAGVLTGLEWAAATTSCKAVVTAAADTPFLPMNLADSLATAADQHPGSIAVACSVGRRHPTFALWPIGCRGALRRFLVDENNRRVSDFIERHGLVEVEFPPLQSSAGPIDPFFNINVPADLVRAGQLLQSLAP
jgi:molybdopterin-guanine dinucleotide biosynthesis protein A